MKVDTALVDKIAALAKLRFDDNAKEAIRQDLEQILDFADKLNELDTAEVEPLIYITEELNALREDEPGGTVTKEEALKNAPQRDSDYFKVPKVLDK